MIITMYCRSGFVNEEHSNMYLQPALNTLGDAIRSMINLTTLTLNFKHNVYTKTEGLAHVV